MNKKQKKTMCSVISAVSILWLAAPLLFRVRVAAPAVSQVQPEFDAQQAFQTTAEYVTRFPHRVLGSIEARQSTGFLRQRLEQLGYTITYTHFDAVIAGKTQVGRNLYGFKAGQSPGILAILAHYDTARTTVQGAMDDGSGVGIVLELARVFSAAPVRHSLLFVATDGEEWGMLGAADMAANYPGRAKIVAALSLDYLPPGELRGFRLESVGQGSGYTPPWLRNLAGKAVKTELLPVSEPAGLKEHLERAFLLSWTDQGPLLDAGIPAINLCGRPRDNALESAIYHSAQDTIEKLQPASFGKMGQAAERLIRSLDNIGEMPVESMSTFHLTNGIWLPGGVTSVLHFLIFLPILFVAWYHLELHRESLSMARVEREILAFSATLFPFLLLYGMIVIVGRLRLLPLYGRYPATPRDPILSSPNLGVLVSLATIFLLCAVGCYFLVKYLSRSLPAPGYHTSKSILLTLLCLLCILAFLYNSYWTVAFIALPAWAWTLVGRGQNSATRTLNRFMIVAAGISYYLVLLFYARALGVGWNIFWYQLLALNCGMFRVQAYMISSAAIALGVRMLSIQSQAEGPPS